MIKKLIKKFTVNEDNSVVKAVSLVDMPAIMEDFIFLNKENETMKVMLDSDEKHMVYGAVLVPDLDIYRYNNGDEYYLRFDAKAIEKLSIDFMQKYRQKEVTVDHQDYAPEVTIVESWLKSDIYKDKSVALGLNDKLPVGTWFIGMKVNNVDVWEDIKEGKYKGFSVESWVDLEEYTEMKAVHPEQEIEMEEQQPEPAPEPTPTPEPEPAPEPQPEPEPEPSAEPEPQPAPEQPAAEPEKNDETNHLEDLIKSMRDEIAALKSGNEELQKKLTDALKKPSAAPINPNAGKGVTGDSFSEWRNAMRKML